MSAVKEVLKTTHVVNAFPFPKKTVIKRPRFGSLPAKQLKNPGLAKRKPVFQHMGQVETEGHWAGGRWVKARGVLGHRQRGSKPVIPGAPRERGWVRPWDRVEKWYLWKGDKVRLLVGKNSEKFVNEDLGASSGYKVYTIENVDMERNRVVLKELTGKRSGTAQPKPLVWDSMTPEEQQQWQQRNTISAPSRTASMSSLSLLVEEHPSDPAQHVWATRMRTTNARWNHDEGYWSWDRYAIATTGQPSQVRSERGWKIQWPKGEEKSYGLASANETDFDIASEPSLQPVENTSDFHTYADAVVPSNLNAPSPKNQLMSDAYIKHGFSNVKEGAIIDSLMPLYLSEELSPRFARMKKHTMWKARSEQRAVEKNMFIQAQVDQWKAQGRDRYLREIMDMPEANLRGVPIRPRTEEEITEAAKLEFDEQRTAELRSTARRLRLGYLYDYEKHRWFAGPKAIRRRLKWQKKVAAHERRQTRLQTLRLSRAKNMVVPDEIRATDDDRQKRPAKQRKPLEYRKSEKSRKKWNKLKREDRRSWANVRRLNGDL